MQPKRHSFLFTALVLLSACHDHVTPTSTRELETAQDRVAATADDVRPLLPGQLAPAFALPAADGTPFVFDPTKMERPLVLTFYRGGWCPHCNRHLSAFRVADKELREMGFDVVFLSADRVEVLEPSLKEKDLGYTLVSDNNMTAARAYGVAFKVDDATVERYLGFDIDLEAAAGNDKHILPVPATFLIGTDGIISFQYTNPNYRVRIDPEVLLAAARAHLRRTEDSPRREPMEASA